jgi:uncharacterized OB-fold protein
MSADPTAGASAAGRARPVPSALTAEFWAAAAEHVLVRPVCRACGHSFFTPQIACPRCLSEQWDYVASSGRGTVYSASVVHRGPSPLIETPYQIGIVDLEEGWSMLSNIVDCGAVSAPIGTEVEVAWLPLDDEIVLPVFAPVRSAA